MAGIDRLLSAFNRALDRIEKQSTLQLRQATIQSVDRAGQSASVLIGGESFPRVSWSHPDLYTPTEGSTVWVFEHGARGKDFIIWGPTT